MIGVGKLTARIVLKLLNFRLWNYLDCIVQLFRKYSSLTNEDYRLRKN